MPIRTVRIKSLFASPSHSREFPKVDPPPAAVDIEAHRSHQRLRGIPVRYRFVFGETRPCSLNRNCRNDQTPEGLDVDYFTEILHSSS
jgi:hypothetical protein